MDFVLEWPPVVGAKFSMPDGRRVVSGSASSFASSSHTFPRRVRLTTSAQFARVLRHPQVRERVGPVRVICAVNSVNHARLGLIVGRRAVAPAAERNRIKRVVREYFRHNQHELGAWDLVVQILGNVGNARLRVLLGQAFGRLHERRG